MTNTELLEVESIKTLSTPQDLSDLARAIRFFPSGLNEAEGPDGKRPSKFFLRALPGTESFAISCSYGQDDGYLLATTGDTLITYSDNSFAILPTGTSANIHPPQIEDLHHH